jgi:guanylate kinase
MSNSLLIVISGPSGAGKDTVINKIKRETSSIHHTTTITTRSKRNDEKDGIDYHFTSEDEFKRLIEKDGFLEWATVYGNLYGTPKQQIRQALADGLDVIAKVDVQGALAIKKQVPDALFIWISAPSIEELDQRLRLRNSDSKKDIELRIQTAHEEIKQLHNFDYKVINRPGHAEKAADEIVDIILKEKNKPNPRQITL